MKRLLLASLAVSLVSASSALAQPTREQYIAQADPVCQASMQAQSNALGGFVTDVKHGRLKKAARKFRRAGALLSVGIDQLAALEAPPADAPLLGDWLASLRNEVSAVNRFAKALAGANLKQLRKADKQLIRAIDNSTGIVAAFGFQVCSQFGQ
jgi:hypothetical protein